MELREFASRKWKDLNDGEWKFLRKHGIYNGCGTVSDRIAQRFVRWLLKWLLKRLRLLFMHADCNIHDFTYWQGGDERRRFECDLGFFEAIIADIERANLKKISVLKYTLLALIFYYAVRFSGRDYFNYC